MNYIPLSALTLTSDEESDGESHDEGASPSSAPLRPPGSGGAGPCSDDDDGRLKWMSGVGHVAYLVLSFQLLLLLAGALRVASLLSTLFEAIVEGHKESVDDMVDVRGVTKRRMSKDVANEMWLKAYGSEVEGESRRERRRVSI